MKVKKFVMLLSLSFFLVFPIFGYCYEESLIELEPNFYKEMLEPGTLVSLTLSEKMNLRIGTGAVFRFKILMPPGVKSMFINTESNQWSIGGMDNPRFGLFEIDPGPLEQPTFADLPNVGTSGLGLMLQRSQVPIEQATNAYFIGYNPTTTPFNFTTFSVMMSVEDISLYNAWYNARQANGVNYEGIGEIFTIATTSLHEEGKKALVFDGVNITNDTTARVQYSDENTIPANLEITPNQFVTLKSSVSIDSSDVGTVSGFVVAAIWGNNNSNCYSVNNTFQFKIKGFFNGEIWTKPTRNLPTNLSFFPIYTRETPGNIVIGENALLIPLEGYSSLCFFTGYVSQNKLIGEFSDVFSFRGFENFLQ